MADWIEWLSVSGGILQLAGVGGVAWKIQRDRKAAGLQMTSLIPPWVFRLCRGYPKTPRTTTVGRSLELRWNVLAPEEKIPKQYHTLEEQVNELHKRVDAQDAKIAEIDRQIRQEIPERISASVNKERDDRIHDIEQLKHLHREQTVTSIMNRLWWQLPSVGLGLILCLIADLARSLTR